MTADPAQLVARAGQLRSARVLCVGDLMLDRFVYGEVERISPEAPIQILHVRRESAMLGGAGNVVRNLVALGAQAHFLAAVGDDTAGREVTGLIADQKGVEPTIVVEADRQTTIKTRFFAASQQLLRVDRETSAPLSDSSRERMRNTAAKLYGDVGVVILSD